MNIQETVSNHNKQEFLREYSANAFLPPIAWQQLFKQSKLSDVHLTALDTLYHSIVPLALNVFEELQFDVFSPAAYRPQGLGLFEKLTQQEQALLTALEHEARHLDASTRLQIWSMLLRGGAVLVFKAWLGKVKTETDQLDMSQFDELSDLLFLKTEPHALAAHLNVDPLMDEDHIFLMYDNEVYLDRFNCLQTAALFVDLGVYDATFLSLRDARVAHYLKEHGYVTDEQIDELQCALNPLFCSDARPQQSCLA